MCQKRPTIYRNRPTNTSIPHVTMTTNFTRLLGELETLAFLILILLAYLMSQKKLAHLIQDKLQRRSRRQKRPTICQKRLTICQRDLRPIETDIRTLAYLIQDKLQGHLQINIVAPIPAVLLILPRG